MLKSKFNTLKKGFSLAASSIACTSLLLASNVQAQALDKIIAIVNNDVLLASDFQDNLSRARDRIRRQSASAPNEQALRSRVLENMILYSLLLQQASEQGIRISDRQLNAAVANIAANNGMSVERFRQALTAQGQDFIATREQIRRDLIIKQVQQSNINQRIQISDREVENFLRSKAGKNNAEVLISDIAIDIASPSTPQAIQSAKERAESIYQQLQQGQNFANLAIANSTSGNALNGGDLGWRKVSELPSALASAISKLGKGGYSQPVRTASGYHILQLRDSRNTEPAKMVQQSKVRHILISPSEVLTLSQAKRKADQIYQQLLRHPEQFPLLAEKHSNDPGSRSQGGDLGWAQNGQMVPEFEQVMNTINIEDISAPFESRFGWHVLQVTERKQVDVSNRLQETQARQAIGKRKFAEERENWLRELRSEAYVEIK